MKKRTKNRIKKGILTGMMLVAFIFVQVAECLSLKVFAAEPSVVVSDFAGLYSAILQAQDGDVIGINDVISINADNIAVGDAEKHVTIVRLDAGAFLNIASSHATIQNITFDGNGIAAYYPMCQANYHTDFVNDSFHDCKNADGSGGAIRGVNGNINLTGCTFTNNEAVNGGHAFFQDDVTVTIQNCTFTGGHASTDGGGLYIQTSQANSISGCTITGNTADRIGGGILNHSSLSITDSRVYSNTATVGGADIANRSGFNVMVEHDMEALAPLFADLNLLPVEWVNDFNSEAGVSVDGFEPTVANTFLKLTLQEITEDPGEDPDPGTGGGSEDPEDPSGTEPGTGAEEPSGTEDPGTSTGGTEEPSQDPSETPSGNESGSGTEQGGTETPSETPTDDPGSGSSDSGSNTSSESNQGNQGSSDAPGTASETPGSSTSTTTDSHDSTATTSTTSNSSDNNSSSADSHNSTTSSTDSHNSTSSTDNHSVTNNYYTNPERTSEPATQQPQVTVVNNIPSSAVQSSADGQKQQEQNLVQQDNIRIQANGVNVTYEVIDGVHSISINSVQDAQPVIQTMSDSELVPGASAPSDDRTGVNFYEIAKLVLLAGIMVTLLWKRKEKN